jgi:hypothetical protein
LRIDRQTYFRDPVHVSLKILVHLLLGPQLLEVTAGLRLLPLLGELSADGNRFLPKSIRILLEGRQHVVFSESHQPNENNKITQHFS